MTRTLDEVVYEHIVNTLKECKGNKTECARRLGITRQTIRERLRCPPASHSRGVYGQLELELEERGLGVQEPKRVPPDDEPEGTP